MAAQLILNLPVRTALGRDDFFVSAANEQAVAALEAPALWPEGKLLLTGPAGSGRSHLARLWAAENAARLLPPDAPPPPPGVAVAVDDADRAIGDRAAETALFHLHNAVLAGGGRLLMTAAALPPADAFALPDLESRLRATATAALAAPDDALLAALLVKLFADRQVAVTPATVAWLARRIERSFAAAQAAVAALDAAALSRRRPITRALAAEVLGL